VFFSLCNSSFLTCKKTLITFLILKSNCELLSTAHTAGLLRTVMCDSGLRCSGWETLVWLIASDRCLKEERSLLQLSVSPKPLQSVQCISRELVTAVPCEESVCGKVTWSQTLYYSIIKLPMGLILVALYVAGTGSTTCLVNRSSM